MHFFKTSQPAGAFLFTSVRGAAKSCAFGKQEAGLRSGSRADPREARLPSLGFPSCEMRMARPTTQEDRVSDFVGFEHCAKAKHPHGCRLESLWTCLPARRKLFHHKCWHLRQSRLASVRGNLNKGTAGASLRRLSLRAGIWGSRVVLFSFGPNLSEKQEGKWEGHLIADGKIQKRTTTADNVLWLPAGSGKIAWSHLV